MTTTAPPTAPSRRLSFSTQILIGLFAGAALGLFIGERAGVLQVFADAYIKLLQMTVLPYVTISLIAGIGTLRIDEARRLGVRVGAVLIGLWAVAIVAVFLFPLTFPSGETASFFSTTLLEEREPFDLVNLYIPSNPFNSLANNVVPAVVLFSVVLGIALISVPKKAALLDALGVANEAVAKATRFIVSLTPYGMFAIAAVAAGTLAVEDIERLQVYLISYVAISLLLSLWVLPGLVAALTPVPYRALLSHTRDALVTAFMTSSLFVVLPMLTEQTKRLIREHGATATDEKLPEVIIPASFNFPHTGKLLSLSFVLFAGWFADAIVPVTSYPQLAATGLLVLFGNINVAVPFLLDMFRIPADTFQLFVATSVVNARFGTLMSAVHTLTVAVLGTCAVMGLLRVNGRKLARFAVITAVLTVGVVGGARVLFTAVLERPYDKDKVLAGMQLLREGGAARVIRPGETPEPLPALQTSVLDRIRARRMLRVGYFPDSLPYAFFNANGQLVGFDVEMAHQLARDLGVGLELVPVPRVPGPVDAALCDVVMSGIVILADRAMDVLYSASYQSETMAFIVPDHRRSAFATWDNVRAMRKIRLGVPGALPYYIRKLRDELPDAEIVPFDGFDAMLSQKDPSIAAFVATAERGSAYTLRHPEFSVVVPKPRPLAVPLAYIIAGRDEPLAEVMNAWIDLKKKDGTVERLFAHWILGRDATPHRRRWSILDDVLRRGS